MQAKNLGFEQCAADARVWYVVHYLSVSIVAVVQVSIALAVGWKDRCGQCCEDLNRLVSINNLSEWQ